MRPQVRYLLYVMVVIAILAVFQWNTRFLTERPTAPEIRGIETYSRYRLANLDVPGGPAVNTETFSYSDAGGTAHPYRCQYSKSAAEDTAVFVYAHGQSGDENEGFSESYSPESFHRLRLEVLRRGWTYLCIRDYEFQALLDELRLRFNGKKIYVAGQSLGGRMLSFYLMTSPESVDGAVLACPAIPFYEFDTRQLAKWKFPVVLMVGEAEPQIGPASRQLAAYLESLDTSLLFLECPMGDHCQPFREVDWRKVFDYLEKPVAIEPAVGISGSN